MTERKFVTMTKDNIPAWFSLTYTWIINGMLSTNPDLKYGEAMTRADELTTFLFDGGVIKLKKK